MKILYLDESGDRSLKSINRVYPIFVLGGVIVERAYVREIVEPRMRRFKHRFFGRDDVILHTVDMHHNAGHYTVLADPSVRASFYADLNAMLAELDYRIVACVIHKERFVEANLVSTQDLYQLAFETLIEQFCHDLGSQKDAGFISAEKYGSKLDHDLMAAWERLRSGGPGTGSVNSHAIEERIVGLDLRDKKPNLAGMQLADLVITPIGRRVVSKAPKDQQVQWSVVEGKLLRREDRYDGVGLIVLP